MRNNKRNTMRRYLRKFGQWAAACGLLLGAVATHELRAENDPSKIRRIEAERSILEFLQAVPAPDRKRYRRAIDNELEKIKRGRFRQLRLTEETASRGEVEQKVRQRLAAFREENKERLRREAADAARKRFFPWCDEWIELKLTNGDLCFGFLKHTDSKTFLILHRRIDRLDANKGTFTTKWSGELRLEKEQLTALSQSCFGSEDDRREAMKRYLVTHVDEYLDAACKKQAEQYREELYQSHRYQKVNGRYYTREEYYALDYLTDDVSRVLATNRKELDTELIAAEEKRIRAEREARKRAEKERRRAEEEERKRAEEEKKKQCIQTAQEYWRQLLREFAVTVEPLLGSTFEQTIQKARAFQLDTSDELPMSLEQLMNHSEKAYFIEKYLTLSHKEHLFIKEVCSVGYAAKSYRNLLHSSNDYDYRRLNPALQFLKSSIAVAACKFAQLETHEAGSGE